MVVSTRGDPDSKVRLRYVQHTEPSVPGEEVEFYVEVLGAGPRSLQVLAAGWVRVRTRGSRGLGRRRQFRLTTLAFPWAHEPAQISLGPPRPEAWGRRAEWTFDGPVVQVGTAESPDWLRPETGRSPGPGIPGIQVERAKNGAAVRYMGPATACGVWVRTVRAGLVSSGEMPAVFLAVESMVGDFCVEDLKRPLVTVHIPCGEIPSSGLAIVVAGATNASVMHGMERLDTHKVTLTREMLCDSEESASEPDEAVRDEQQGSVAEVVQIAHAASP